MTLVELFFFLVNIGIIMGITLPAFRVAYERYGLIVGIISGTIAFAISIAFLVVTYWVLGKIGDILAPGSPEYCELRKCRLYNDCYYVRLGTVKIRVGKNEYDRSILYYKCRCGKEYLNHHRFFAKVNEDGSLEPYKYCNGFAWYNDKRIDTKICNYAIPMDILQQLRDESTDSSFVFRDKYNCLELCVHCDLVKNRLI